MIINKLLHLNMSGQMCAVVHLRNEIDDNFKIFGMILNSSQVVTNLLVIF